MSSFQRIPKGVVKVIETPMGKCFRYGEPSFELIVYRSCTNAIAISGIGNRDLTWRYDLVP